LSNQGDLQQLFKKYQNFTNVIHKIFIIIPFSFFLFVAPVQAGNDFQYSKPILTDNLPGYKYVVLDKDVYTHSNQLHDLRIFNETDEEVPYLLESIHDAATSKEKEDFIQSEFVAYVTTQETNNTVITIKVNHLTPFRLELNTDDMFQRSYALYGLKGETKRYLVEGTLANLPSDPSLPINQDIEWEDTNPVDQLQLVIHNRVDQPIMLKSLSLSYYLNKLVFKDLGNTHYRLAYGNVTINSPLYNIMDYKAVGTKEPLTQAKLGTEISAPPQAQLPETPTNHKLLFILIGSALALFLITGLGLRKKSPK